MGEACFLRPKNEHGSQRGEFGTRLGQCIVQKPETHPLEKSNFTSNYCILGHHFSCHMLLVAQELV